MKILLTGANGFIGKHIMDALRLAGHEVRPATRDQGINFNHMLTREDWLPHLQDLDIVINSVGIITQTHDQKFTNIHYHAPIALFHACVQAGVKRVVQISALGVDEHAFTPYQKSKKSADDLLRSLALDWFVLRPSLVYGQGSKSFSLFQSIARLPVIPRIGSGAQLIQPVHINDMVDAVKQCMTSAITKQTLDVVGPYPLTLHEWLQIIRTSSGMKPATTCSVPFKLAIAIAKITKHFIPLISPDNLRMLQRGNTANAQPFTEFIGRPPLEVKSYGEGGST